MRSCNGPIAQFIELGKTRRHKADSQNPALARDAAANPADFAKALVSAPRVLLIATRSRFR